MNRCRLCHEHANLRGSWFCDDCFWWQRWLYITPWKPRARVRFALDERSLVSREEIEQRGLICAFYPRCVPADVARRDGD